ncbi:uncharacterized protein LOC133863420 [Alnus glutinosa]|uniref:uncharacterized protein LOC133863420 n=1 Tax=Alnus glutinosa TaxID=3517 RepID=UPI002D78FAE4|nr:uncharacterized protein LOC133863420 [Alnus glutinosa]
MEVPMKNICFLVLFITLGIAGIDGVYGAGECGKSSPDMEAFKLAPCASAAHDEDAGVSDRCCSQVKKIGQNPRCLCAAMLSNTAKSSGAKPEVAVTIPKRCNIADRPVGLSVEVDNDPLHLIQKLLALFCSSYLKSS